MNQPPRRSMSLALQTTDLPEEALALIRDGAPKAKTQPSVEIPLAREERPVLTPAAIAAPAPEITSKPSIKVSEEILEEELQSAGFTNASFRLPVALQHALLRVSLERKLKRKKPWTQQDMAIEALNLWLKKNGHT